MNAQERERLEYQAHLDYIRRPHGSLLFGRPTPAQRQLRRVRAYEVEQQMAAAGHKPDQFRIPMWLVLMALLLILANVVAGRPASPGFDIEECRQIQLSEGRDPSYCKD